MMSLGSLSSPGSRALESAFHRTDPGHRRRWPLALRLHHMRVARPWSGIEVYGAHPTHNFQLPTSHLGSAWGSGALLGCCQAAHTQTTIPNTVGEALGCS